MDFSGGSFYWESFSGEFVGTLAVDFDGGEGGNFLFYFANEALDNFFDFSFAGGWA